MLSNYLLDPSDFIIEEEIGHGNFGVVYLVYPDDKKSIKYAMKKIERDEGIDFTTQKCFIREISVMASIDHPNLLKLIGFSLPSKENNEFTIFSEYIPNKTLYDVINNDNRRQKENKKLDPTKLSNIVYGTASAMMHLHQKQIVHRDLKPENIFLDSDYHPILSDFGLSRFINNDLEMTSKLGTPYYMAPELFSDEEKLTNKIDVYAFGMTLLFLFTPKFQFIGAVPKTIDRFAKYITNGSRFKIPADVPEFYRQLINRCWSNSSIERPSFEEIVKEMEENDNFIFEGANKDAVHDYIKNIKNYDIDDSSSANENDEYFEETEEFNF